MSKQEKGGVEPYRPSNASEGCDFEFTFCNRCQHEDATEGGDGCEIQTRVYALGIHEKGYPTEWIEDANGPRCTAFEATQGDT